MVNTLERHARIAGVIVIRALREIGRRLRDLVLALLVLIPIGSGFCAGVTVAIVRRIVIAVIEGYQAGQRLIDG